MIYLASPYSHDDPEVRQARFEAACRAAAKLIEVGEIVYSPIAHSHPIGKSMGRVEPWEFWRAQDEWFLQRADAMYALRLDGWSSSVGVSGEIAFARERGLPIVYCDADMSRVVQIETGPVFVPGFLYNPKLSAAGFCSAAEFCTWKERR